MAISGRVSTGTIVTNAEGSERLSEIAEILATGLTRLKALKSSRKSAELGESSLHFTLDQSGDAPPYSAEASYD
jgi:hypothetical protein